MRAGCRGSTAFLSSCAQRAGTAIAESVHLGHSLSRDPLIVLSTALPAHTLGCDLQGVCASTVADLKEHSADANVETGHFQSIPEVFRQLADRHGDAIALQDPHHKGAQDLSFRCACWCHALNMSCARHSSAGPELCTSCRELYERSQQLAAAFAHVGLRSGDVVAQFSDNSSRWLLADQVRAQHDLRTFQLASIALEPCVRDGSMRDPIAMM